MSPLQQFLAGLWLEILGVDRVGIHDNFFELGGDSIRSAIFLNRLQQALDTAVSVSTVFEMPTIAALSGYLEAHCPDAVARIAGAGPPPNGGEGTGLGAVATASIIRGLPPSRTRDGMRRGGRSHAKQGEDERDDTEGSKNPPAIFILSPPRSGSTLLRVMLAGHPALFAPPELELLSYETLAEKQAALGPRYEFWSQGTVRAIMALRDCRVEEARRTLEGWQTAGATTAECYGQMQSWLGERTLVDKTPSYAFNLETLRRAETIFEQARYIHLVRHPRAMIRSFAEAKLDELLPGQEQFASLQELAESIWLISHENILDFLNGVPAHRQLRLHFEDLLAHPQSVMADLCTFLGLAFDSDMLRPYGDPSVRMTDGRALDPTMVQGSSGRHPSTTGGGGSELEMLGDPKFLAHHGIDARAGSVWRAGDTAHDLGEVTWRLAESMGYERSAEPVPRTSLSPLPSPEGFEEGAI